MHFNEIEIADVWSATSWSCSSLWQQSRGCQKILVFRSQYYRRNTMLSISTRYERQLQLECYRFIRKIHKPTWQICLRSSTRGSTQGVAELDLAQVLNAQGFHPSALPQWFSTFCASTTRGHYEQVDDSFCDVFGMIRRSPVCGDCLMTVVVSTVHWLVR